MYCGNCGSPPDSEGNCECSVKDAEIERLKTQIENMEKMVRALKSGRIYAADVDWETTLAGWAAALRGRK